jgi:hypothetical protein
MRPLPACRRTATNRESPKPDPPAPERPAESQNHVKNSSRNSCNPVRSPSLHHCSRECGQRRQNGRRQNLAHHADRRRRRCQQAHHSGPPKPKAQEPALPSVAEVPFLHGTAAPLIRPENWVASPPACGLFSPHAGESQNHVTNSCCKCCDLPTLPGPTRRAGWARPHASQPPRGEAASTSQSSVTTETRGSRARAARPFRGPHSAGQCRAVDP